MSPLFSEPPLSEEERLYLLLESYLAGDAKSADVKRVRDWLGADPRRGQVIEDIRRIRDIVRAGTSHRSSEEAWRRLLPILLAEHHGSVAALGRLETSRRRLREWAFPTVMRGNRRLAVAMLVLAIGVPAVVTSAVSWRRDVQSARVASAGVRTVATMRGVREEIRLADGSLVTLAPQSELVVERSPDGARNVRLEGEAYFDVVHDERRPFTVHVRNAIVRDVGTRFAIRAYPADSLVRVVVTHGQVSVRPESTTDTTGMLLDPRMLARVNAAGAVTVETDVDTARYVAFRRGQIRFVATPLRDAVLELERWYDIQIRLADPQMGSRHITATIADQTLPDLLDQLRIALNVDVSRVGESFVLSDKPASERPAL